jgi:HK97 family phage major capsid protein
MKESIVLRKVAGVFAACRKGFGMRISPLGGEPPSLAMIAFGLCLMIIAGLLAMLASPVAGLVLATAPAVAITGKSRTDLDKIIADSERIEAEYKGKEMPQSVKDTLAQLYQDGERLSSEVNEEKTRQVRKAEMKRAAQYLREVPDPTLPDARPEQQKEDGQIAGYITPGHLAVLSEEYAQCIKKDGRWDMSRSASIELPGSLLPVVKTKAANGHALISLTDPQVKALSKVVGEIKARPGFERKDLPIFGELVIAPMRSDRFVQDTRPDILTLRDVLTVTPTSAALIQYVAEVAYTSGAEIQSEGLSVADTATKGEDDIEYELRDAPIRTIASTIPVSEQQLADAPALISRINNRLLYGVRRKEEQLCGYGSGTGLEFAGFFDSDSDVVAATTSGSTLIDKIREAQTEVFVSGYLPSFVWIHPEDWEGIELVKGSDGHYVWAIIRDVLGPRIWSMRVVQGVGTQKAGAATRNVLVGDAIGATIYDREQANIAIGWVDDQFAKNLRTIRAEERMTLTIDAPAAFRKINTVA